MGRAMNRYLSSIPVVMTFVAVSGCMTGEGPDLGTATQAIVPGIGTTCASGSLEGNLAPDLEVAAPWAQVEGSSCGKGMGSCAVSSNGQIEVSRSGLDGLAYTRVEPRAIGATQVLMDVNVAIRPDPISVNADCPSVPIANISAVVSDGTRMAGLAVGRMRGADGVETSYIALRSLDRCSTPIAIAPFAFNINNFHVYSLRLDRAEGATIYVDKEPAPALQIAYDRLEAATPLRGAQYGFRTERAVATWDYLRYSSCGVASAPPPAPVSSCGGAPCPGNRPPNCGHASPSQAVLWPPNHSFRPERVIGLTDADGDEVSYAIDYVTSDEATDAPDSGNTAVDVGRSDQDQNDDGGLHVAGDGQSHGFGALLRAERSGGGNGRVYAMHVTANDGRGGTCETTVRVCVPHDNSGAPCVDDGQTFLVSTPPAPPPPPAPVAPGTLRCPAPSRALAGSPVTLRTTNTTAGARVSWSVISAPSSTRAYRFATVYNDADVGAMVASGVEVPFTSVIVGDFTVHAEATYPDGTIDRCDTTVSMLGHGLRVELTWNTQDTDVDLHALDSTAGRWFTSQDCFYANRRPDSALPASNRRWLDTDDVDGEGPENIRVDTPTTDRDYQIGVHFYSSHGHSGATRATVVIYCGEQRMGSFERDLSGIRSSPDANDFWNVASVRFDASAACTVQTLGRLTTASVVRSGG
jgi:hypothetical protein